MPKVRLARSDLLWELECIRSHNTSTGQKLVGTRPETAIKAARAFLTMTRARLITVEDIIRRYERRETY